MFTEECGIVGVDIDHCRSEDGTLNDTAKAILEKFPSYTEISPSGTGLHIFYHGIMPGKGNKNSSTGVEIYARDRYFTMTGQHLKDTPGEVADGGAALPWIYETYIAKKRKEKTPKHTRKPVQLTDEDVLMKARAAANGEEFSDLWEGNWKDKYGSQSEADLALCLNLAFWTGKNAEQMDRLFRQSALLREKWDTVHHADGSTYGSETIRQAIERTEQTYSPEGEPAIFERNGRYYRVKGDSVYPITNFIVHPIDMIISDEEAQMTCDLVTVQGESFRQVFMTTDFGNALNTKVMDVGAWHKDAMRMLGSSMPSRVVNNLACCVVGLRLLESLCTGLSLEWGQVFPIGMDACVRYLVFATREYLLDGGETNKSVVEQTLEVMDRMGLSADNCRMLESGHIAIHFKSAYDLFTKYRRDYAIVGECLTYPAFMRQLRKSDLYVEDKPIWFDGELRKATALNYTVLKQRCDVAGFMNTEVEALT